jgi:hypothetical protein
MSIIYSLRVVVNLRKLAPRHRYLPLRHADNRRSTHSLCIERSTAHTDFKYRNLTNLCVSKNVAHKLSNHIRQQLTNKHARSRTRIRTIAIIEDLDVHLLHKRFDTCLDYRDLNLKITTRATLCKLLPSGVGCRLPSADVLCWHGNVAILYVRMGMQHATSYYRYEHVSPLSRTVK